MTGRPDPWAYVALLDALALNNVLALVRQRPGEVQTYRDWHWQPLQKISQAVEPGHPWVKEPLSAEQTANIIAQAGPPPGEAATTDDAVAALEHAFRKSVGREHPCSIRFGKVYSQWLDVGPHLQVEVVSNAFLPAGQQLALAEQLQVLTAGLAPPPLNGPNWSAAVHSPEGFHSAAEAVTGALAVYGVTPAQIVGALARKAEHQPAVGRSPKDRVVCLKKLQPNGTTSYYVYVRTADWHVFELYWEDETGEWKDFPRRGMLERRLFHDPDPEWVYISEDELPAPLPDECRG